MSVRLFGLIGFPLTHSFSRKYFTEKFLRESVLDAEYLNFPLVSIRELPYLIEKQPLLRGLNVTIPYKESVLDFLDEVSPEAAEIGAVNTIKMDRSGKNVRLLGFNTDVYGFRESLAKQPLLNHRQALVLGTGGASKAVMYVLKQMGITVHSISRNEGSGVYKTYSALIPEDIKEHTLIVNTTPLGMFPHIETCPDLPYDAISENHLLFDLVYNPSETLFLKKGAGYGARIVNGSDMLIFQAEKSWEIYGKDS